MDITPIEQQVRRDAGSHMERRDFGAVEWVVAQDRPEGAEQTLAVAVFDPGGSNAEHVHPNAEEIVMVLEGEVKHTLGSEATTLRAGDVLVVPRDAPHRIINASGAPCRMVIIFSSPDRAFVPTGR